jgi:hypothetical protein
MQSLDEHPAGDGRPQDGRFFSPQNLQAHDLIVGRHRDRLHPRAGDGVFQFVRLSVNLSLRVAKRSYQPGFEQAMAANDLQSSTLR